MSFASASERAVDKAPPAASTQIPAQYIRKQQPSCANQATVANAPANTLPARCLAVTHASGLSITCISLTHSFCSDAVGHPWSVHNQAKQMVLTAAVGLDAQVSQGLDEGGCASLQESTQVL